MKSDWTKNEIELILNDYFQMFNLEVRGEKYNKTAFRKLLLPQLNNRTEGSIEFKHQNISAVLQKYGQPYIVGYKPLSNYQALLEEYVVDYLCQKNELDTLFAQFATEQEIVRPMVNDYANLEVDSPILSKVAEPKTEYVRRLRKPNYLEIEQRNQKLGELGEELIFNYEKWRLSQIGKVNLAEKVQWISKESGDGAGFDILSRNENGTDRYIEVKTTKLGDTAPFYFTRNELKVSQEKSKNYFLYRVFKFNSKPKFYSKNGSFDQICSYEPTHFKGRIG